MECQRFISGENKKNIFNLLSAEFVNRVTKIKNAHTCTHNIALERHFFHQEVHVYIFLIAQRKHML